MMSEYFSKIIDDCGILVEDIQGIINELNTGTTASRKSLEKTTRLRKDVEELKSVENTDINVQFVKDKLTDIFGG